MGKGTSEERAHSDEHGNAGWAHAADAVEGWRPATRAVDEHVRVDRLFHETRR